MIHRPVTPQVPSRPPRSFLRCVLICSVAGLLLGIHFGAVVLLFSLLFPPRGNPSINWLLMWTAGIAFFTLLHAPLYCVFLRRRREPTAFWVFVAPSLVGTTLMWFTEFVIAPLPEWMTLAIPLDVWIGFAAAYSWVPNLCLPGTCHKCDYDLRGLSEPRCPECGTPFDPCRSDLREASAGLRSRVEPKQ